ALEPFLDVHEILQESHGPAPMRSQEPRAGGVLDVAAPGLEQIAPSRLPPLDLFELLDPVHQLPSLLFELVTTFRQRGRLTVELLDVELEAPALLDESVAPLDELPVRGPQPVALAFERSQR